MNKEVSSNILDDAREKISQIIREYGSLEITCADKILALSGTTEIECPECKGSKKLDRHFDHHYSNRCPKCNGHGVIKHKWEIGVHLENGELPDLAHRALDWILATKDNEPCQIADELESFLKELDDGKRG